jgi:hypothetical protein
MIEAIAKAVISIFLWLFVAKVVLYFGKQIWKDED